MWDLAAHEKQKKIHLWINTIVLPIRAAVQKRRVFFQIDVMYLGT